MEKILPRIPRLAKELKTIITIATREEQEIIFSVSKPSLRWSRLTLTLIKEIVVPTQSQIPNSKTTCC